MPAIILIILFHYNKNRLLNDLKDLLNTNHTKDILNATMISYIGFLIVSIISSLFIQPVATSQTSVMNIPIAYVYAVTFSPVFEELICRSFIYHKVMKKTNSFWFSASIAAIVFSILHFNLVGFLGYVFIGLTWSYFYRKTNNILVPILSHALFNVIALILMSIRG